MKRTVFAPDYQKAAEEAGITWLGPLPANVHLKTRWQCNICGHVWEARINNIRAGRNCPECGIERARTGKSIERNEPEHFEEAARQAGIIWHGPYPDSNITQTKTEWECPQGHRWMASLHSIKYVGSGCPHCAGVARLPSDRFNEIAENQGLTWIGPVCKYREKTEWKCPNGHRFWAQYGNVRAGKWKCPECGARGHKSAGT